MSQSRNPWLTLGWGAMALGAEAASVIGLRVIKIATGGPAAGAEAELMIREKIAAAWDLQSLAMSGGLGFTAPGIAAKTVSHYRRRVRANRRRLSKSNL